MRQAYDYWQDQPGSTSQSFDRFRLAAPGGARRRLPMSDWMHTRSGAGCLPPPRFLGSVAAARAAAAFELCSTRARPAPPRDFPRSPSDRSSGPLPRCGGTRRLAASPGIPRCPVPRRGRMLSSTGDRACRRASRGAPLAADVRGARCACAPLGPAASALALPSFPRHRLYAQVPHPLARKPLQGRAFP